MKKNLNDYLTIAFKPYVILVSIGTTALLVSLLPKLFPYLTEKDVATAILSGLVTLVGVYAGWVLGIKRDKDGKYEELKFKKDLINHEIEHIKSDIDSNVDGILTQLEQLQNGSIRELVYTNPVMTVIFDEHFKHAALSFSPDESKRIKNLYKNAYSYNKSASIMNKINDDFLTGSFDKIQQRTELAVTDLVLRSAEIMVYSGLNHNGKAEELKKVVNDYFDSKKT